MSIAPDVGSTDSPLPPPPSKHYDGGPAFPQITELGDIAATSNGMTLRDYFAAKAMQVRFGARGTSLPFDKMAEKCYALADAMIKEKNK